LVLTISFITSKRVIPDFYLQFIIGLAASLGYGAASELIRRSGNSSQEQPSSIMLSKANIRRLVLKLSQMRGAALKVGQFLSIQGSFCGAIL
jgi:predicted unusual protein kinase regulating ubiquinone biosynthesis (AarF/ABC1/UbiB family)